MQRRRTSLTNPTYKLTETERLHVAWLDWMGLWPRERIAKAYGVSRKTVAMCRDRWEARLDAGAAADAADVAQRP